MNTTAIVRDDNTSGEALAIVEKYEAFFAYLYPILQTCPRKHGALRDVVIAMLARPIGGLYQAAKSRQVSRLYAVDADFATLRSYMRILATPSMKVLNPHRHGTALALLAEPGRMLGAWQKKLNPRPAQARHDEAAARATQSDLGFGRDRSRTPRPGDDRDGEGSTSACGC